MKQIYKPFLLIFFIFLGFRYSEAQVTAGFTINLPTPACNPAVVSFTNTSTGTAPLTYKWNFGVYSGTNSIFQNPSTTYIPCGTFTVTLYVTDGTGKKDSAKQNLTIECSPTADFSISSTHGCSPFTPQFADSSKPGSGTIASELWDFGDGYLGSGPDPSHTYTAIGCNTITLIVKNSFGCKADTTVQSLLCVYKPPVVSFTSSNPSSCAAPFTVNFDGSATGGLGPYSFLWNFTNASPAQDSIQDPSATFTSTGTSGVQVIATDQNGCRDTVTNNTYINIAKNSVDFTVNSTAGCAPFNVWANSNVTGHATSYQWNLSPGGLTSNQQNANFLLSNPGTYILCLTVGFSGGCSATKCDTITVYAPPTADFYIAGNAPTCLKPSQLNFTDNSSGDSLSYSWNFPGGIPSTFDSMVPPDINYNTCGSFSAALTVTDLHGCSNTKTVPNMFTITCLHPFFTVNPSEGCTPLTSSFNSSGSTGGPFATYYWDFGDPSSGAADTSSSPNPVHTYNNKGCYNVTLIVTTGEGCVDTLTVPDAVCAGQKPHPAFTNNPPAACANQTVTFTNTSTNVDSTTKYQWDFKGGPNPFVIMSTDSSPSYIYNDTGWFNVTLVAIDFGCSDTITHDSIEHVFPPVAVATLTRDCSNPYVILLDGTQSMGADTYTWTLPGGNPSSASTPTVSVTYSATGNYTASLFVTNTTSGCTNNTSINITIDDVFARFSGSPLQGCAPLISCMSNTSIDGASCKWTIYNHATGLQVNSSSQTSPCFSFTQPGVYDVKLVATDQFGCQDSVMKTSYIQVWGVNVGFYGTPLTGCAPLPVQFTDTSSSSISTIKSWLWNFGDPSSGASNTSTLKDPTHTYKNPGFYTVELTITDNHGCIKSVTKPNYIDVVRPAANFSLTDTSLCFGQVACFTNTSTGNGLTYSWSFGNGNTSDSIAPCITYYVTGQYTIVLAVKDNTGCVDTLTKVDYVTITKPIANFVADTTHSTCPPLQVQFTNLSTQIDSNTTYYWNFGDSSVSIIPNPIHIYNLPGSYTVTLIVTNRNGCSDTLTIPDYITIGGPKGYVTDPVKSGCNPLTTCFIATAPSAVYFTWNFGDGNVERASDSICYTYTRPGTFHPELILDDGAGCIYALPIGTIKVGGSYAYFKSNADTLCGPGSINFTDSSWSFIGIASRQWNFGDPASGFQNTSSSTSPSHYYSTPGTYYVSLNISSNDGCNSTALDTVVVKPLPVANFIMSNTSVCPPSDIQFTDQSTSSSPIVSWLWNFNDPASGTLDTTSQQNPSHLYTLPGTYNITLTIVDLLGCSAQKTLTLVVHPPAVANAGNNANICINTTGTVLNATGGVQYAWTPSTGLSATNISSPLANPTVTTAYTVVVTTGFGCVDSANVIVYVHPVPQIDSSLFAADTCSAVIGSATVFVSNGTLPYSYSWSNNATTASINNLHGGITYNVTVTDSNSCEVTGSVTVPALPPPGLSVATVASTCSYSNGSVALTISGGQTPYTYLWSNGATTQNLTNILAGPYTVTVTDAFKCVSTLSVTVNNMATPVINLFPVNTTCSAPNGSINLVISGGTPPFTYNWNNGATTQSLASILAGTDSVIVTDSNGCTISSSATLIDHPGPVVIATPNNATCNQSNGSITLTVSSGTAPYTFNWNNGSSFSQNLSGIFSGNYNVLVTDSNSCADSLKLVIGDTPRPKMSFTITSSSCGFSNGGINVTMSAGIAPFTFSWSSGDTTQNLTNVKAGNYHLTITGANGCTMDTVASISDFVNAPVITASPVQPTCGYNNGMVSLTITGGHAPYIFDWNSGTYNQQNIDSLAPGNYFVQVTDSNGCIATANASLSNVAGPTVSSTSKPSTCGNANGSVTLTVSGGTAPYTYSWNNGATTRKIKNVLAGTYNVTVADANGCIAALTQVVTNIGGPSFTYITNPATCTLPNGSITLTVSNGTTPYTFAWNTGATNQNLSSVAPGSYSIVITDANGCTTGGPITLTDSAAATLVATGINPTCGNDNGSVSIATTGYGPFSYSWNGGSYSTQTIGSLAPGSYSVVVTDVHSCTSTATVTLNNIPGPAISGAVANATCGNSNGAINITLAGGTTPFTYQWSDSAITQNISSLAIGNYSVTVVDSNGCSTSNSFPIVNIPGPSAFTSSVNATCGNSNGSASISTSGGTSPFTYSWSNGGSSQTISNLMFGTYYATVTDSNNCAITDSAIVTGVKGPTLTDSAINTFCGLANGSVSLTISGGTSPFTYNWNSGTYSSKDLFSIPAGSYSVNVTDANGCQATASAILTNTPGPSALSFTKTPSTCGRANGTATVAVTGGTAPYTYSWSTTPIQTDSNATSLSGNNSYNVTVTDANGCSITGNIFVPDIAGPSATVTAVNTTCGLNNGAVTVSLSNGTAPFTYTWNNGATTQNLGNLSPALYQLVVSDSNGCIDSGFAEIDSTSKPVLADSIVNTTCGTANGAIYVATSGGISPYTYNWSNGATTENLTAISNGNYSLLLTDASGCMDSIKAVIKGNPPPALASNVLRSTCGFSNGAVSVTPSGGTAPFTYLWNNSPASTDSFAIDLAGNTHYIVLVSDSNGCTASDTLFVPNVSGPTVSVNSTGMSCGNNGGSIDLSVTGGTPPYSYSWNNGKFVTPSLGGLPSGNYIGVVTDSLGCDAFTLVKITSVPPVQATGSVVKPTCGSDNGSIALSVSSGTSPYTFAWSSGDTSINIANIDSGTFTITITDSYLCTSIDTFKLKNSGVVNITDSVKEASCNSSNGAINIFVTGGTLPYHYAWDTKDSTQNLANLAAGAYSVTVTDSTGCSSSVSINVGNVNGPLVSVTSQNTSCNAKDGSVTLSVTGVTPITTYIWGNGATTQNLNNLAGGTYDVTITDSLGCKAFDSVVVVGKVSPVISSSVIQPTCSNVNGTINITTVSGIAPYTFAWNNGATSQDLTNITAGTFILTVTDSSSCSVIDTYKIINHGAPTIIDSVTQASCNGSNGGVTISVSGGISPYTYSWSTGATSQNLQNVIAGNYSLTVSDSVGCSGSVTVNIGNINGPQVGITYQNTSCNAADGSIALAVTGLFSTYSYKWSSGATTQNLSNLAGGTYNVTVTDSLGCKVFDSAVVVGKVSPVISSSVIQPTCSNVNGTINITTVSGIAPYTFAWNNGATSQDLTNITTGIFVLTVTDSSTCSVIDTYKIINHGPPTITDSVTQASCNSSNGGVTISVSGGISPYTYSWNTGATSQNLQNVIAGNYSLTVTDSVGCSGTATVNIGNINGPQVGITYQNTSCNAADGSIALAVTGSFSTYSYLWNNGATTQNLNSLAGGTYNVTVTDSLGCKAFDSTIIASKVSPKVAGTIVQPSCGTANGSINVSITSGISPYTFAWNNGASTQNLNNINTGPFIVLVTDSGACSTIDTFNLSNTGSPAIVSAVQSASCGNSNGSISINVSGGISPYQYKWNTGKTMQNLDSLVAGNYTLVVTDSLGCSAQASINVGNTNGPVVVITSHSPSCNTNNGTVNLTVTGASSSFSYKWNNGASTKNLTGLPVGTYNVTVTDSLGCKAYDSIAVINSATPQLSYTSAQPTCGSTNGSIDVSVKSGTPPYTWSWSNNSTKQNLSAIGAGNYKVTVKDSLGCTDDTTVILNPSNAPVITLTPSSPITCANNPVTIIASGANSFTWSPSNSLNKLRGDTVIATISSLTTFTVTGSDSSGCSATKTIALNIYSKAVIAITAPGAICKGSSTTLSVAGNGNYRWSGPAINGASTGNNINVTPDTTSKYYIYFTDGNGCPDTSNTVVNVSPIPVVNMLGLDSAYCFNAAPDTLIGVPSGGTFSGPGLIGNIFSPGAVTVGSHIITYSYTDSLGCSNSISKPVTIRKEASITAVPGNPTICHFSSTTITASGCTGYNWSPAFGLSATTGAQVIARPDTSTYYTVVGTDSHGCSASTIVIVNVAKNITVTLTGPSPAVCLGNNASLSVSGANTYQWSPATGLNTTTGSTVVASPTVNSTYTITGSDISGCTGTGTIVVKVNPIPVLTTTPDTFVCDGSAVPLNVDGAQTYKWSPAAGLNNSTGSAVLASPGTSTTYNVIGTDVNGCTAEKNVALGVRPNPVIAASDNKVCAGQSATLSASGGASYIWSPTAGLNTSTGSTVLATASSTTTYTVTGSSSFGCTSSAKAILTINPLPTVNFTGLDINYCINNSSVALNANPSGGTFSGPGMNGNIFNPKVAGVGGPYSIVYSYTDNNGCAAKDTQPVNIHAQPDVNVNNASVCSGNPAQLIAQGATTYTWSPSTGLDATTGAIVNSTITSPVQYTVTGSTINGCSASAIASVSVSPLPQLYSNITSANVCTGGSVFIEVGGAQSYQWFPSAGLSSSNANQVTVTPTASTIYIIIGQNSSGCSDTITIPVNVLPLPAAVAGPNGNICVGGSAQLDATGNGTFSWSPSQSLNNPDVSNPVASPNQTTTYTLTVTAANGCTAAGQMVVTVYSPSDLAASGGGTVCLGDSTSLEATGGYDYQWTPANYLNNTTGERVISKPTTSITYTVTANTSIGCPASDTVVLNLRTPIYVKADAGATICAGESYQLNAYGTGVTYLWSPAGSLDNAYIPSPVASPTVTTTYTVVSSDLVCFTAKDSTVLIVRPRPALDTKTTVTIIPGSGAQLYASGDGTFTWTPAEGLSCTNCADPIANPTVTTTYTVTVTDSAGCRAEASVELNFLCDQNGIYVPNAFTPNGDGKNDVFRIRGIGVASVTVFRVYSRWGEKVFETNDINEGWDGTYKGEPQFPAVYVYYIEGICTNGQTIVKQGNVTLIR